ncbi:hypothetical protein Ccrd_007372 [Cynara cardunculus var. scolymus]|uniref:Uncharacterized protein n=1 Tax=Cynara cardunculus var. scolymus TaxID=59895 RepID=A0A118JTW5_CYNCS|nr:hypothetical protein Ccrd_007372 [Cynara cardunculus var. scolymus]
MVVAATSVGELQKEHCVGDGDLRGVRRSYERGICTTSPPLNLDSVPLDALVAGCGLGGMLGAFSGLNTGIPYIQKHVKGPKWLPFVIGIPPLLAFSAASAAFGGMPSNFE